MTNIQPDDARELIRLRQEASRGLAQFARQWHEIRKATLHFAHVARVFDANREQIATVFEAARRLAPYTAQMATLQETAERFGTLATLRMDVPPVPITGLRQAPAVSRGRTEEEVQQLREQNARLRSEADELRIERDELNRKLRLTWLGEDTEELLPPDPDLN